MSLGSWRWRLEISAATVQPKILKKLYLMMLLSWLWLVNDGCDSKTEFEDEDGVMPNVLLAISQKYLNHFSHFDISIWGCTTKIASYNLIDMGMMVRMLTRNYMQRLSKCWWWWQMITKGCFNKQGPIIEATQQYWPTFCTPNIASYNIFCDFLLGISI